MSVGACVRSYTSMHEINRGVADFSVRDTATLSSGLIRDIPTRPPSFALKFSFLARGHHTSSSIRAYLLAR